MNKIIFKSITGETLTAKVGRFDSSQARLLMHDRQEVSPDPFITIFTLKNPSDFKSEQIDTHKQISHQGPSKLAYRFAHPRWHKNKLINPRPSGSLSSLPDGLVFSSEVYAIRNILQKDI